MFIHVTLERQPRAGLDAFERAVRGLPDVHGVERLIVDEITRIPGVSSIRTSFALKRVLYSTALPLRHLC